MTDTSIDSHQIAEAAFYLWLEAGKPEGRDLDHWIEAKAKLEAAAPKPKRTTRRAKPKADAATTKKTSTKTAAAKTSPKAAKAPAKLRKTKAATASKA